MPMKANAFFSKCLLLAALVNRAPALGASLPTDFPARLDAAWPGVEQLYLDLHRHPELAFHEQRTAAALAARVRALGYEVTTGVGGTGVVAVLKNGPGPVVMLRTEMDALPVPEKTGLPYASQETARVDGQDLPVMHACGHDTHMAAWYGTAQVMAASRAAWRGTLLLVGQPAEETAQGAAAMLRDGLFTRFPKPAYALSMHDEPFVATGQVGWRSGYFRVGYDALAITVFGRGGHGAAPADTADPVVQAARLVEALQTLVSREQDPVDPLVITVGSIHGGTRPNVIPDQVKLEVSVRTTNAATRQRVLDGIARVAKGVALAAGAPREPQIDITTTAPAVYNDPELTARAVEVLRTVLGEQNLIELPPRMASEDFGNYTQAGVRTLILHFGAVPAARLAEARAKGVSLTSLPMPHSPLWAPDYGPAIRTAITAETAILLDLFKGADR
jgi:hippurate hydrolase